MEKNLGFVTFDVPCLSWFDSVDIMLIHYVIHIELIVAIRPYFVINSRLMCMKIDNYF